MTARRVGEASRIERWRRAAEISLLSALASRWRRQAQFLQAEQRQRSREAAEAALAVEDLDHGGVLARAMVAGPPIGDQRYNVRAPQRDLREVCGHMKSPATGVGHVSMATVRLRRVADL